MEHQRLHNRIGRGTSRAAGSWVLIGLAVVLLGVLVQPRYLPLCEMLKDGRACSPISKAVMAGYSLVMFGVIAAVLAPIVLALRAEAKTDERSSPAAWRAMNYGVLAGFLYVGAGVLLLVLSG